MSTIFFPPKWSKIPILFKTKYPFTIRYDLKNVLIRKRFFSIPIEHKEPILDKILAKKYFNKQRRTSIYYKKISRHNRMSLRRDMTKKNGLKEKFRMWFNSLTQRQFYLDRESKRLGLTWKIKVSTVIERIPVIKDTKPQWEQDYLDLKAYLGKISKDYPSELVTFNHNDTSISKMDMINALLPHDFGFLEKLSLKDSTSLKSLSRKLDKSLYFTILPKENRGWIFPTVDMKPNNIETILDASKRAAYLTLGSKVQLKYLSNCPLGVDLISYDLDRQSVEGVFGEKVFYIRAYYVNGCTQKHELDKIHSDWAWLDSTEVTEIIKSGKDEKYDLFYHYLL